MDPQNPFLTSFFRGMEWKGLFASTKLVCRTEQPVMGLYPWGWVDNQEVTYYFKNEIIKRDI